MKQFNLRLGNIEARIGGHLVGTLEIVQWSGDSCWAIVSFSQNSDGRWNAVFVGYGPLEERVDWNDLRKLIKASYEYLVG